MMMTAQHPQDNSQQSPQSIADYLAQLLKDRKQLAALPNVFTHLERLLDEGELLMEIRVHSVDSKKSNKNFFC